MLQKRFLLLIHDYFCINIFWNMKSIETGLPYPDCFWMQCKFFVILIIKLLTACDERISFFFHVCFVFLNRMKYDRGIHPVILFCPLNCFFTRLSLRSHKIENHVFLMAT